LERLAAVTDTRLGSCCQKVPSNRDEESTIEPERPVYAERQFVALPYADRLGPIVFFDGYDQFFSLWLTVDLQTRSVRCEIEESDEEVPKGLEIDPKGTERPQFSSVKRAWCCEDIPRCFVGHPRLDDALFVFGSHLEAFTQRYPVELESWYPGTAWSGLNGLQQAFFWMSETTAARWQENIGERMRRSASMSRA
jgi:hypothetical protein